MFHANRNVNHIPVRQRHGGKPGCPLRFTRCISSSTLSVLYIGPSFLQLELGLGRIALDQSNGSGTESGRIALLDLCGFILSTLRGIRPGEQLTEDDLVAFLPHLSHQCLTGDHSPGKAADVALASF